MDFGKIFKEYRTANGISGAKLGKELNLSKGGVWKIEKGKVVPSRKTLRRFCELSGISMARLVITALEPSDFS